MTTSTRAHSSRGYTFAEVLVASALLGLLIGGAVSLIGTMHVQERTANAGSVALNIQENAARLWQLGLSAAQVAGVIPTITDNEYLASFIVPSGTQAVSFGTLAGTTLASSMGTMETITCTVTLAGPQGYSNRNVTAQVHRPVSR